MAEFIDREKINKIAFTDAVLVKGEVRTERIALLREIDEIPAADVIDNTHGKWLHITRYNEGERMIATCSRCRERGEVRTTRTMFGLWEIDSPFCPSCGVEMDGKDDN